MAQVSLRNPSSSPVEPLRLRGDWYVRHSTRSFWWGKRNVQVNGFLDSEKPQSNALPFSYQELTGSKVWTRMERGWKVLGEGRNGKLPDYLRETEWGLEDSSGEIRAEYRAQWILIHFPASLSPPTPAGVDILSSSHEVVSRQTLEEIGLALGRLDGEDKALARWTMYTISRDRGRDKEMEERKHAQYKEWQNRTGPAAGISPDLTYNEDTKGRLKCLVQ